MSNYYTDHAYAVARNDFKAFVRFSFNLVHPGEVFADNFHIDALCYRLSRVREGHSRRLAINLPPRTLKSFIVSVAWPAFILGNDPSRQIFVISHNEQLAARHSQLFRKLIEHPRLKQVFPKLRPAALKNTELTYSTSKLGGRTGLSTFTGLTGMGADFMIFDDPISAQDATSQKACDEVARWIKHTAMSRFNDLAKGAVVCVMQRLSIWDPHAQLTDSGKWTVLALPAIATSTVKIRTGCASRYVWRKGELLHPDRLPQRVLDEMAQILGPAGYQAQFMQTPSPAGGGLIDVTRFKTYDAFPRKRPDSYLLSIDAATGGATGKSYSVILVFAVFDGSLYLHDLWRERVPFPELKNQTIKMVNEYIPRDLIIEYASSGISLCDEISHFLVNRRRNTPNFNTRLHDFKPKVSKEARWDEACLLVYKGRVYIPRKAPWLQNFTVECRAFPEGTHDDQVDAMSQALIGYNRLYDRTTKSSIEFMGG